MKKCSYCGKEYADETNFCPVDGQPLKSPAAATPPPVPVSAKPETGLAVASMVLGILSLMCGPFLGIAAVICGHIGLNRAKKKPQQYGGRGFAITGLVTGYVGTFITGLAVMAALLLPALAQAHNKARRIQCLNNLKQIGIATKIWSQEHKGTLPNAFMDMTNLLASPRVLVCPSDPDHNGWPPTNWSLLNPSYQLLTPGASQSDVQHQVIVRCPIHGNELMGDGSVKLGKKLP